MNKPFNEYAFPHIQWHPNGTGNQVSGMTLRDWFAGMALQGYLASWPESGVKVEHIPTITMKCFQFADAMLKERLNEQAC